MSYEIKLSVDAKSSMQTALDWTFDHFGLSKHDEYAMLIEAALDTIATDPLHFHSKDRSDIMNGIRTYHISRRGQVARHILVYRINVNHIVEVLQFLHDAMDIQKHILEMPDNP